MEKAANKIEIRDVIAGIFRNKNIFLIIFIIGVIGGYIGVKFQTSLYSASVKMYIKGTLQPVVDYYQGIGTYNIQRTQIEIVQSEPVLRRVVEALHLDKVPPDYEKNFCTPLKKYLIDYQIKKSNSELNDLPDSSRKEVLFNMTIRELKKNLMIDIIPGTDIFTITVNDMDPDRAISIANVISRSYTIFDQLQDLAELKQKYGEFHPTVLQLKENIENMTRNLSGRRLPDTEAIGTASVKVIEQANSDYKPIGKPKRQIFALIVGLSIALGLGLAFGLDYIDQTFKSIQDIITFLNIPVIGSVPKKRFFSRQRLFNDDQPNTLYTQFSDDLADQFYVFIKTQNLHSVLFTSVLSGEGTTNTAANLAVRLSQQMSCKTLLIDANFTNPSLYKKFDIKEGPGLANILEHFPVDIKSVQSNVINTDDKLHNNPGMHFNKNIHKINPNLDILPAGKFSNNPECLINESIIGEIINHAKEKYEVVLVDSACLKKNKYVEKLALLVDGITLVVCERKIRRRTSQIIIGALRKNSANFFGAVLNKRTFPIPKVIYNRL